MLLPHLEEYRNVKTKSIYLFTGCSRPLKHMISFSHQCGTYFKDKLKFVDVYFDIQYGNHHFYVISDSPACFMCKHIGHYAHIWKSFYELMYLVDTLYLIYL